MCMLPWLMLCVCAVAAAAQLHNVTRRESGSGSSKRVVCYYTNWSVYRPGTAKFTPQNINPYLCTHLIYAFGGLTRENSLRPYDKYQDIEQGGYAKFTGLKTYNKQLKTLLAIGGWNEGSTRFSPLVADEERRSELVHNVVRFLRQNHFDGLDLDWEYPAFRDGGKPRDRENYALLVQELRAEFDRESAKTGRPRLLLTMAVPAGKEYIDKGYDIPKLNRYLDFMNILSYDYHSAFEPAVNHHSPLYPLEEDSEYNFDAQLSIDYTVKHYLKLGADRDKLVLGIPTYGRSYTLYNPLATEIGSPADGPGEQGDATREKGYLAYYEICDSLKSTDWKVEQPNPSAMGPYAYRGNQWVGYDDISIVKLKARYVSDNGLGGIMFWAIDNDDFRGKCHGRPYPLIEAGKEALLDSSATSNDVVSVAPSRDSSKPHPKRLPSSGSSTGTGSGRQGPQGGHRTHKKRPSSGRHHDKPARSSTHSTTSTTSTTPAYNYPHTTPEPPTTPDPGSDFKCKDEGFFPHPRDCKKYFWCLDSGPSNLGIVAHQFTCPSGLFFNKGADSCDYARNVVCKKKSGETDSTTTKTPPITAATSRTTRIGSSTAPTTTTSTTTTTPEPIAEEEEYDEDEEEEEDDDDDDDEAEEDPQAIKELINLIKKLGGLEQLEKQLHLPDSEQDSKTAPETSGFSRSLYDRVLNRNNNRGNSAFSGDSPTTPRYASLYRNRPVKPQNDGLEGFDEVKAVRRDKPQYVTIKRDRPTPEPEHLEGEEEEEEEEEEELVSRSDDIHRDDVRPRAHPVEYVTIRRTRPSASVDTDGTSPRYITIHRQRKPVQEPEIDGSGRDLDVQDVTTEIRPVYMGTTERASDTRVQIVTPVRTVVTETQTGYRKSSQDEDTESATLEPELKVSAAGFRVKPSEPSIDTYPQYVDVTSIGRRRHDTDVDKPASVPPLEEEPLPQVEINSITRRRNVHRHGDFRDTATSSGSPQSHPESPLPASHPQYADVTGRSRGTAIPKEDSLTSTIPTTVTNRSRNADIIYGHRDKIFRTRGTTVRSTVIPSTETEADPNFQTTPTTLAEPTPPGTLPPPTTTRFTPTVTRIITSITESGTTHRQRISVNRVPYIAIAALRGETVYPGAAGHSRHSTVPIDQRILHPTTASTVLFQPEATTKSSLEEDAMTLTIPTEHKTEKVMEVNRITSVTLEEELPNAYTRALSGNETTDRMFVNGRSEMVVDKVSEVSRMKYVTVVDDSQTPTPAGDYATDMLPDISAASPTPLGTVLQTMTHHENTIDTQDEPQSSKPHYSPSTSSFNVDSHSTDQNPLLSAVRPTTKQTTSTVATTDQISSTDTPLRSDSPFSNRRHQVSGRKPGVDDFKRRRTRPTFSTTSVEPVASSTPSAFSKKRRGQRKRPRPYRPSSTTVAEGEAEVFPSPDDSNEPNGTVASGRSTEPRRTFVPKTGQRKRPNPYLPPSAPTKSAEEVINPVARDGSENIVVLSESISNETTGFIPKAGNRRRGTTQKPTTETSGTTQTADLTTVTELQNVDKLSTLDSSDNVRSSTQGLDTFIPDNRSKFVPRKGKKNTETDVTSKPADDMKVSSIKHPQNTENSFIFNDTSQGSDSVSGVTDISSDINSTERETSGSAPELNETLEQATFRATSPHANTELVTPASTEPSNVESTTNGPAHSDRVRIKKRRRRPTARSSVAPPADTEDTSEEPTSEGKTSSGSKSQETKNEIKFTTLNADGGTSGSNPEENPVTSFATAALLERDHYEISTAGSVGEFVTTVDREGKRVVKISLLNEPDNNALPRKNQRSKSVSNKGSNNVKNSTTHNPYNDFVSTTAEDKSDLRTDGSGYTRETTGKDSIYTPPASIDSSSEEIHDSYMTTTVQFLTEGHSDGNSRQNSDTTVKAAKTEQTKNDFIASIDFTADSRDDQTLGSSPATGRNKPGSARPDTKTRRVMRRKGPSSTTAEPQVQSEVVTTTTRTLRRPAGALYNPNRVRHRSTTTTSTTTATATAETPATSTESEHQRRKPGARLVLRRKYGSSVNRTRDSDATASEVRPSDASDVASTNRDGSGGRVRKYSFPRRRPTSTPSPVTTTQPVTTLPTTDTPKVVRGENQLPESKEQPSTVQEVHEEVTTTKLSDLANPAVVAIHNLATAPPTTQPSPEVLKSTRATPATSTTAAASLFSTQGSKLIVIEQPPPSSSSSSPSSASPRRLPGNASLRPRPFSKTTPTAAPTTSPRAKTSRPTLPSITDYEYYDDDDLGILDVAPISGKVKIHSDGYIECLDRGNFPHPFSCKKFISCAKMENGELLGWEYTCPRQLSFDPIGGICNWSAGLGCKE